MNLTEQRAKLAAELAQTEGRAVSLRREARSASERAVFLTGAIAMLNDQIKEQEQTPAPEEKTDAAV